MSSKLPDLGTADWAHVVGRYEKGDIDYLVSKLDYAHRRDFVRAMRARGIIPGMILPEPVDIEEQVLSIVKSGTLSVGEISRRIDRSKETVIKTIDALRSKSYEVILDETTREVSIPHEPRDFKPTEFTYFSNRWKIGVVTDTHIGSKYQQMTLLHDAYSIMDSQKVDFVLHAGDLVDGVGLYRGQQQELFLPGAEVQKDYTVKNYPKLSRRKTYVIGGQHDYCFYKQNGHNIVDAICKERSDLIYRGFFRADFKIKGIPISLVHPGGGVSYARSYKSQKHVENLVGSVVSMLRTDISKLDMIPALMWFGHWHIPCHLPCYMGVDAVSLPCFQAQTPYLAEKGLMPTIGYTGKFATIFLII